jgi:hypothetical protein
MMNRFCESSYPTPRADTAAASRIRQSNESTVQKIVLKLKAEFQGSNRDIYRPESVVASGSGD